MMKDLKKYSNKTKAAFILLVVMLIIIVSNFNTLENSKNVNENINAIYKDRLVVAHYIFQYSKEIHFIKSKAEQTDLSDSIKKAAISNTFKIIRHLDGLYAKTVLTPKEKTHFQAFLNSCQTIHTQSQNTNWKQVSQSGDEALKTLELLSEIQITEGKAKLKSANEMYNGNNSLGQLQIALLIILGGITFYLLLIKKKKTIRIPEPPSLN